MKEKSLLYSIISYKDKLNHSTCNKKTLETDEIFKIKRLSDNQIFTLNQSVCINMDIDEEYKIIRFDDEDNYIYFHSMIDGEFGIHIENLNLFNKLLANEILTLPNNLSHHLYNYLNFIKNYI